ncbi:MAG TPA: hypothetical protein VMR21_02045 [Vicinamibacteria bacterium]|nr:hypothetical protein [Vicinamibacteria bacterium]
MRFVRQILAPVVGYAVIAVLTSLLFASLPPFRVTARWWVLVAGTLGAVIAGLCGGATAALVAVGPRFLLGCAVLVFLVIDTAVVLSRGGTDPVWFDLGGSVTLMAATVAGAWLAARRRISER